jgi:16S rRNA U1498 N3-methylase RsmE
VPVIDTNHLVEVLVAVEGDAITLMQGHGMEWMRDRNDSWWMQGAE